ncbi:MAG: TonB family protein [Fibrobacter sp.]|jgi:TonB family protein|nr:TonB family protein [Fibrobacter sp.]
MRTFLKFTGVILLLAFTGLFNVGLVDIRFEEIRYLLGTIASQEDMSNTFGIVAKYELIKHRIAYGEENVTSYELEAKIQALTSGEHLTNDDNWSSKFYRTPVRMVLNTIRILLGKKIINPKEDDKIFKVIEIGYFWERNRRYLEALKVYDEVLKTANLIDPEVEAAVMVHKAFCYSMLSNYGKSKEVYEAVIAKFPNTEAGILAWKLIDFINSLEKERSNLEHANISEMERAKQFYLLMDFRNSIKNFSLFLGKKVPAALKAEAHLYKGRSHEELGEIEEAIMEYKTVIKLDKSKTWARQAHRRMLMLGEFYEQQKSIAEEAKKQLKAYQDQMFLDNVEKYKNFLSPSSLKGELLKGPENQGTVKARANDSILNLINQIGNLDLTGEEEAKRVQAEQMKKTLIEQGKLSTAEIKEFERRQAVAQNPYRRPSALKKEIDGHTSELKYIYNKKLRSGTKLSGRMLVAIKIAANGHVTGVNLIQSNMGDKEFEKSIVERISTWRFKAVPDSLGELTVNYPFEFDEEL